MIHSFAFTLIGALLSLSAAAQTTTTYTIPSGTVCGSIEGCYYENLTATAGDGSTLYGRFEAGGYWTQFQYEAYQSQNPGYNADYCNGTAVWTVAATPDLGPTAHFYTMDCNATDLHSAPSKLHAEIQAHSYVATYVCGGRVRTTCHQTKWAVDSGDLAITK